MKKSLLLACAIALIACKTSSAAMVLTDRALWEAAVTGITNDPFDNDKAGVTIQNFDSGVVSETSSSTNVPPFNRIAGGVYENVVDILDTSGPPTTTWTFPGSIIAVGFDAFAADIGALAFRGNDGAPFQVDVAEVLAGSGGTFVGVIGDNLFSSIEFFSRDPGIADQFQIDNLAFATGLNNAVPEPSTWTLMSVVAFGFAGRQIRKRRAAKKQA